MGVTNLSADQIYRGFNVLEGVEVESCWWHVCMVAVGPCLLL